MTEVPNSSVTEPIFAGHPDDWRDLQARVADIFRVAGCDTHVEKEIETVRGTVSVDVWAKDVVISPALLYLGECKYWKTAVTKTVVHAFRTVIQDSGAHVGYLISHAGFQSGAFEAAENSNVVLVKWQEFQQLWVQRWKAGRIATSEPLFTALFEYYDYFAAPIGSSVAGNEERLNEFDDLKRRYSAGVSGNKWGNLASRRFPPSLPHTVVGPDGVSLTFHDYSSLFDWYETVARRGLEAFRNFVKKYDPVYFASRTNNK